MDEILHNKLKKLKEIIKESNEIFNNGWFNLTIEERARLVVIDNEIIDIIKVTKIRKE